MAYSENIKTIKIPATDINKISTDGFVKFRYRITNATNDAVSEWTPIINLPYFNDTNINPLISTTYVQNNVPASKNSIGIAIDYPQEGPLYSALVDDPATTVNKYTVTTTIGAAGFGQLKHTATYSAGVINLTWTVPPNFYHKAFDVYYSTSANSGTLWSDFIYAGTTTSPSYAVTVPTRGATYRAQVAVMLSSYDPDPELASRNYPYANVNPPNITQSLPGVLSYISGTPWNILFNTAIITTS